MSRPAGLLIIIAALVLGAPAVGSQDRAASLVAQAQGGDVKAQLRTAIQHAGFAAEGDSLGYVRLHLGHTLNCIEGPNGKNFDRGWGNVCQGQGSGIMVDLRSIQGGATYRLAIEHADALAAAGVASRDVAEIKIVAKSVGALLTVISDSLK